MMSPRAARLAGALAAACTVVVVLLPGCRAALGAPNGGGHYDPSSYDYDHGIWDPEDDDMNPPLFNHESKSDAVYFWDRPLPIAAQSGNVPSDNVDHNHESMSYLLPALPDERISKNRARFMHLIDAHVEFAEKAMVEAARSIHGLEPDAKYKRFWARTTYKKFFKDNLSTILDIAKKVDPFYAKAKQLNNLGRRRGDEAVVEAAVGLPPSNYERWTVAKWIMTFAQDRCSNVGRDIKNMALYEDKILFRTHKKLDGLKILVDKIENMANEFVALLQADGESTEQKQSVAYTEYAEHYNQLKSVLPMT